MHKTTTNPLRISQESLDLDDIISDLNSEVEGQSHQQQDTKPLLQIEGVKKQVTMAATTQKQQQVSKTGKLASATTGKAVKGKENDSSVGNQKQQTVNKQTLVAQAKETTETKATSQLMSHENLRYGGEQSSINKSAADMFSENNVKPYNEDNEDELRINSTTVPFYLKNAKGTSNNDEDVESFQRRLDTLIVNFRGETMSEFMRTKKQLNNDSAQTLDAERRRFNTLLGVKQNEIEQLKESLANKTRGYEELNTRCEVMALWAGKAKTLLRIKFIQASAFNALKTYRDFQIHSRRVLDHRARQNKENLARKVFQGWQKQYRAWKIIKNREDFEKAVKLELQHICAQYNKEIESLREKLNEANSIVESEHRNKSMMQENLKKAFMRGVCALNFEAMHILNPNDQGRIEMELEKQVANAMNFASIQSPLTSDPTIQSQRSNVYSQQQQQYENQFSPRSESNDGHRNANESAEENPFVSLVSHHDLLDYKKVESKDSMWKPAPIMGREILTQVVPSFSYNQPTITSQLKGTQQLQSNLVLPSHFNSKPLNLDLNQVTSQNTHYVQKYEEDTAQIKVLPGNPQVIHNSSSLPDFVSNNPQIINSEGGRTIVANQPKINSTTAKLSSTLSTTAAKQKQPSSTYHASLGAKKPQK